jgi:hypothetical protein
MAAATAKAARDLAAEIAFLTRPLKAPTLRESVPRLAERARAEMLVDPCAFGQWPSAADGCNEPVGVTLGSRIRKSIHSCRSVRRR